MLNQFKKLKKKQVKIVYKESDDKIFASEGILQDANPSFVCVKASNGLIHFIATGSIVRISERFKEQYVEE